MEWVKFCESLSLKGTELVRAYPYGHGINKHNKEQMKEIQLKGIARHPNYKGCYVGVDLTDGNRVYLEPGSILMVQK